MRNLIVPVCIVILWLIITSQHFQIQRLKKQLATPQPVEPAPVLVTAELSEANFGPNDVLVLTFPGCISERTADRLKSNLEEVWPGRKSVVLGDGLKLSVLHQTPTDPAP